MLRRRNAGFSLAAFSLQINHRVIRVEIQPTRIQQRLIIGDAGICERDRPIWTVTFSSNHGGAIRHHRKIRESLRKIGLELQRLIEIKSRRQQHESVAQVESRTIIKCALWIETCDSEVEYHD